MIFFFLLLLVIKKYHFFVLFNILWIFFWLIYSWTYNYFIWQNLLKIDDYYFKEVVVIWESLELYKKQTDYNIYILKLVSLDTKKDFDFYFLLYTNPNIILNKWQIIKFKSKINKIENFSDSFNNVKYMQSKNVYFSVFKPKIEFISEKKLSKPENYIIAFRKKFLDIIYQIYPQKEASFLSWLLIWAKENLDEELLNNFNNSWLTHIISVSWFNITIIIIFLGFLLKYFPLFFRVILISVFVIFFVLIVWNTVSVIRAAIMWLVGYYILVLWRNTDNLTLILFTAFLMILYNPLYLNYDTSFQLSFLAVLWLLYFQDFWNKIFKYFPSFLAIKDSFVLTMSALTTTLPIMIFSFWKVSVLAPISNVAVWWFIPFAMLFWFLSVLWQLISDKLWFFIWFINFYILKFIISVADYIWSLSFSVINLDFWIYSIYLEIVYFLLLLFSIIYVKKETTKLW